MTRIGLLACAILISVTVSSGAHAQSQRNLRASPGALVADLYKAHRRKRSPFFQTRSRALLYKYFEKSLADMIWKDAVSSKGEVGAIDGDPLYEAQDTEVKHLVIGNAMLKGETGTVHVAFTNFGKKKAIDYRLKKTTKGWRIDDIVYDKNNSLRK